MRSFRALSLFAAASLLMLAAGCGGGGPEVVPVTGTLTYKGKAVPNALLHFLPEKGRQSWAKTDAEGRFKVHYDKQQDGAVVGKHKVWVEYKAGSPAEEDLPPEKTGTKDLRAFFAKYNYENSKIEVQVVSGQKEIKLDLD